ncbi:GntR family transcriptional regulator [Aquincola tertiaricarbonis]|uniref:GntR family transcriptional regulator n=1 Tax=Aquincola tertiaricarbonis TaxID=391953 RepID=UPI0018DC294D|nr:GntR family transcriptional regulator [Aquincola tertiaricarbonis]
MNARSSSSTLQAHHLGAATRLAAVTTRLRDAILSGVYRPGQRLTEVALSEEMNTSRTPVTAALKALVEQGLVLYATNRGYWVREFSLEEVLEAYEVRGCLEGLACRRAAERGLPAHLAELLRHCLEIGERVTAGARLAATDHAVYQRMNVEFHNAILEASGNRRLNGFVQRANEMPIASDRMVLWGDREIVRRSHDAHVRVLDAIQRGQGTRAEMLMREHIHEAAQVIEQHWHAILARAHAAPSLAAVRSGPD